MLNPKISIIAIDMPLSEEGMKIYKTYPVRKQIDYLIQQVEIAYKNTKKKHPENSVLAALREYSVFDNYNPFYMFKSYSTTYDSFISPFDEEYLIEQMENLTLRLQDLAIISGGVSTVDRDFNCFPEEKKTKKLTKLAAAYKNYSFVKNLEASLQEDPYYSLYESRLNKVVSKRFYSIVRNRNRVFYQGKCMATYDKIAPSQFETPKNNPAIMNTFFIPSNQIRLSFSLTT